MQAGFRMIVASLMAAFCVSAARAEDSAWVNLLANGLTDWKSYFQKTSATAANTWKITPEGWLHVDIQVNFSESGFGHLFYMKKKLSYYLVRAEYRFPANTFGPGWGQGWNRENNGLMLHSQDPATMNGKDFPTSIEVQLLGKNNEQNGELKSQGFKYATSANMCSPGTFIAYNGNQNFTTHCTAATYPAAWKNTEIPWDAAGGWSDVTVRVLADSLVQHFIHGQKVMEYTRLRVDAGTPLKEGYLSVQAEGTSTQFRKLEVLELTGCMDQTKTAYRTYFVKNDPAACNATGVVAPGRGALEGVRFRMSGNSLAAEGLVAGPAGSARLEILSPDGRVLAAGDGDRALALPRDLSGVFLARVRAPSGTHTEKLVRP